jgi:hypothetical protein
VDQGSTIVTEPLSLQHPSVIRGAERIRAWRESGFPRSSLRALCHDVNVRCWLLATGWQGTDGSSCSFDNIQGVQIGRTGGQFNRLPATLHDVAYELIRRFQPPRGVRAEADAMYADECRDRLSARLVPSLSLYVGMGQCYVRWAVLRLAGWRAASPR